jgi:hypothetical protein
MDFAVGEANEVLWSKKVRAHDKEMMLKYFSFSFQNCPCWTYIKE